MRYFLYFFLISILGSLIIYGERAIAFKLGAEASAGSVFSAFWSSTNLEERIRELEMENEDLRAQILREKLTADTSKIKVYASYPFNNSKEIVIAAGSDDGIKEGDVITSGKNLLVGRVSKVFSTYSVVNTIFDPGFKFEVRVGEKEENALFSGGNSPTLNFLSKKAEILVGDMVFTASLGFPYGLEVGRIKEVSNDLGEPVKKAIVEPVIDLRELKDVQVYSK